VATTRSRGYSVSTRCYKAGAVRKKGQAAPVWKGFAGCRPKRFCKDGGGL